MLHGFFLWNIMINGNTSPWNIEIVRARLVMWNMWFSNVPFVLISIDIPFVSFWCIWFSPFAQLVETAQPPFFTCLEYFKAKNNLELLSITKPDLVLHLRLGVFQPWGFLRFFIQPGWHYFPFKARTSWEGLKAFLKYILKCVFFSRNPHHNPVDMVERIAMDPNKSPLEMPNLVGNHIGNQWVIDS